jgi:hypothetical protein
MKDEKRTRFSSSILHPSNSKEVNLSVTDMQVVAVIADVETHAARRYV